MAAGLRTLEILRRDAVLPRLERLGQRLEDAIGTLLARTDWPLAFVRCASLFWFAFGSRTAPRRDDGGVTTVSFDDAFDAELANDLGDLGPGGEAGGGNGDRGGRDGGDRDRNRGGRRRHR